MPRVSDRQVSSVLVLVAVVVSSGGLASRASAQATIAQGTPRNFLTCPIVRDTPTVPCWLAEFDGEIYFLGVQQGSDAEFYPPQLGHEVLVEGVVSSTTRICGGIPLSPVRASVMRELAPACQTMLPQEDGIEAPWAPRPAGPDAAPRPVAPPKVEPPIVPPYAARDFTVYFDFDNDFLTVHNTRVIEAAVAYAKRVGASRLEVVGQRSSTALSNGHVMAEARGIAETRAKKLTGLLVGLGVSKTLLAVSWNEESGTPDPRGGPALRRVTLTVRP